MRSYVSKLPSSHELKSLSYALVVVLPRSDSDRKDVTYHRQPCLPLRGQEKDAQCPYRLGFPLQNTTVQTQGTGIVGRARQSRFVNGV